MTPLLSLGKRKEVCNSPAIAVDGISRNSVGAFLNVLQTLRLCRTPQSHCKGGLQMPLLAKVFY